ncbi:MAG: AAA family ATPase [Bifidobacteriaceae bacterium]|nr:AAA family ATPase [Bifidobacteriaceae bacterium]
MILFRGSGADARRYLESDRSRADDYYLQGGAALARFAAVGARGEVATAVTLTPERYAAWVEWADPLTGESMGRPRQAGATRQGSPRFAEMVVNVPKSLSVAAALHPAVSDALDAAMDDAVSQIRCWLGRRTVTRVGPRTAQEVVPAEQVQTVAVSHKTSRAGDPHRHIHLQIGARVKALGGWRGLDTAALFRQQGAIRALGAAVIAAHPGLANALDQAGLTLDPATGEVVELARWNTLMGKRGEQVATNLARFEAAWRAAHPGEEPGPVARARLHAMAWDHERPAKKPASLGSEAAWLEELEEAGYTPDIPQAPPILPVSLDDLRVREIASRALDRCAAARSAWTAHDVREKVARIVTEAGVRARPDEFAQFVDIASALAIQDCVSVLPPGQARPEHVAHLTTLHVIGAETRLRDALAARAAANRTDAPEPLREAGLDADQARAAAAVASRDPLVVVVVEGAAGAGKTTMLGAAIRAAALDGRAVRVVTPTKKAADVAASELGVPADSVAALVHAHGWRWNSDGAWRRLAPGDADPATGAVYGGPPVAARLRPGDRIVVDEAGMLDQDAALALLAVADEAGAGVALVGDRAQLPAVGRGGVLDMAASLVSRVSDLEGVHRFADPEYARLTLQLREGRDAGAVFDWLDGIGLVRLHGGEEALRDAIGREARGGAVTAATNDEARELNAAVRAERVRAGEVDDSRAVEGSDGLRIGSGGLIQTRSNDSALGVANRQVWVVRGVSDDGSLLVAEAGSGWRRPREVELPAGYVREHAHLTYAATAYGVQGVTAAESDTVLSDAMGAAGLYVGLTRGRAANRLHVVAADLADARRQFVDACERDRADRGLSAATVAAGEAVVGLVADGAAALVNRERARLVHLIEHAEAQAERWGRAAEAVQRLESAHRGERERLGAVLAAAQERAALARGREAAALAEQAAADGVAMLEARGRTWAASAQRVGAGRIRRRAKERDVAAAARDWQEAESLVLSRWGSVPQTAEAVPEWAKAVANAQAGSEPQVAMAAQGAESASADLRRLEACQLEERTALRHRLLGGSQSREIPAAHARRWAATDRNARGDLARIESLPPDQAAAWLSERSQPMPPAPEQETTMHFMDRHRIRPEPQHASKPDVMRI